ncbi:MAG: succinate-semialdehyde dehydrogenase / glutarate-semialdehyde dehydrogenase, partial [Actinomycetota bacterium]|nr:succinate-semialdehyde dehydrogenase / glutarate-semialdehyde dehydrogenase [Actinomycetota bacterium]
MTDDVLSKVPTDLFIGGTWRAASEGGRFDVTDPATGEVIAQVADGSAEDGLAAVTAAAEAGPAWATTPPRQRAEILRKAWALMTDRADEIATLISLENGKALVDAKGEATYAAEFFRWYAEETVRMDGMVTTAPSGANRILVVHQPVGVCVLVTPWNFPAAMATRKMGPALGAGCTLVLKPASDTPLTALLMAQILDDAGVPPGVINVVPARRSGEVVAAMVNDDRVRKLSFTGSTEVGRTLLKLAADSIVNTSMELGGNAPFLVFADADIDAAIEGAMIAKMRNGGEACTAANRFYVHEDIAEEFTKKLTDRMGSMTIGRGVDEGVEVGPLVEADQR